MRVFNAANILAGAIALSACGAENPAQENEMADSHEQLGAAEQPCAQNGLTASGAWLRAARAGQPTTAGYLEICNGGGEDRLLSVSFSGAAAVEIHQSVTGSDGVSTMSPAPSGITLAEGETVSFAPEGAHIMLIGLTYALNEGAQIPMTLHFAKAPPMDIHFEVRDTMKEGEHSGH